ncbi:hypothetical protein T439DRAFT_327659 [Meredithblackwellia eburnea MCA 4105]
MNFSNLLNPQSNNNINNPTTIPDSDDNASITIPDSVSPASFNSGSPTPQLQRDGQQQEHEQSVVEDSEEERIADQETVKMQVDDDEDLAGDFNPFPVPKMMGDLLLPGRNGAPQSSDTVHVKKEEVAESIVDILTMQDDDMDQEQLPDPAPTISSRIAIAEHVHKPPLSLAKLHTSLPSTREPSPSASSSTSSIPPALPYAFNFPKQDLHASQLPSTLATASPSKVKLEEPQSRPRSPTPLPSPARSPSPPTVMPDLPPLPPIPTHLGAPFRAYTPPLGLRDDDTLSGDEAKRAGVRRMGGTRKKEKKDGDDEEEEEKDDRLYCICKELYDPERMMIACDKCENWYHLDCIHIEEDEIELVDILVCPLCEKLSTDRTTYHRRCSRPTCLHPCVPLSKYCSDYCGISVAASRLSLSKHPDLLSFYPRVMGARRRVSKVVDAGAGGGKGLDESHASEEEGIALLRAKLDDLVKRRTAIESRKYKAGRRVRYLKLAVRRWEALCQATADALREARGLPPLSKAGEGEIETVEEAGKPKGKKGKAAKGKKGPTAPTSLPEAQCGFDHLLVLDDVRWGEFLTSEEGERLLTLQTGDADGEGEDSEELWLENVDLGLENLETICLVPRKKCERHKGWQTVRQADFEVEVAVLARRLTNLDLLERRLRTQLEDMTESSQFRALHRSKTSDTAIDVSGDVDHQIKSSPNGKEAPAGAGKKRARTMGGGSPKKEKKGGGDGDDVYEVPEEVFKFLSRREQVRLKAQMGKK